MILTSYWGVEREINKKETGFESLVLMSILRREYEKSRVGVDELLSTAEAIWTTERRQAQAIVSGENLRLQINFREYLAKRAADPAYTFRQHLRNAKAAIEE